LAAARDLTPCLKSFVLFRLFVAMLYSQIFQYLLTRQEVAELTLEDPSESFEDLRDREDLKLLFDNKVFEKPLSELVPVPSEWYEKTRTKWKLANVSSFFLIP
jgi:histone acetyltransferase 1